MKDENDRAPAITLNTVNTIIAVASLAASIVAITGQYSKDEAQDERDQDERLCKIEANVNLGKCGNK